MKITYRFYDFPRVLNVATKGFSNESSADPRNINNYFIKQFHQCTPLPAVTEVLAVSVAGTPMKRGYFLSLM